MKNLVSKSSLIKTLMLAFLIYGGTTYATVNISFPNHDGTGSIGGGINYFYNDYDNLFKVTVSGVVPSTYTASFATVNQKYKGWDVPYSKETKSGFVAGANYSFDIFMDVEHWCKYEGLYQVEIDWGVNTGAPEVSGQAFVISKSANLQIGSKVWNSGFTTLLYDNFNDRTGNVVLGGCTGSTLLKGKGYVPPGTVLNYDFTIVKFNKTTGAPIGSSYTVRLTAAQVTSLNAGTLNLTTLIAGLFTLVNHERYRITLLTTNSNTWIQKVNEFAYKTGKMELMIKDYWQYQTLSGNPGSSAPQWFDDDRGEELNRTEENVYRSGDVWNQLGNTMPTAFTSADNPGAFNFQNPDYSASNPNYLFTKVNNISCGNEPDYEVRLRMYWTRARLGELWNDHWLYNLSTNSTNWWDGTQFVLKPLGSEITISGNSIVTPYTNVSAPIVFNNTLNPVDGMAMFSKSWYAPNPAWYNANNGFMGGQNNDPAICFLSKLGIVTTSSGQDPLEWEPSPTGLNIDDFVKHNNNVATRNTYLLDDPQFLIAPGGGGNTEATFTTAIANNPSGAPTRICINNISEILTTTDNVNNYGQLQVAFTNLIWSNWVANGMQGSGFAVVSPTLVNITNPQQACFDNINIGNTMDEQIGVRMVWNNNASYPVQTRMFEYAIQQSNVSTAPLYRGSDLVLQMPVTAPSPLNGLKSTLGTSTKKSKQKESNGIAGAITSIESIESTIEYLLYPNPTNGIFTISITGAAADSKIQAQVFDISGKLVINNIVFNTIANATNTSVNTAGLAKGIYTVKLTINDVIKVDKLVIQ